MSAFVFDPDAHLSAPVEVSGNSGQLPAPRIEKPKAPPEWLHGLELLGDRRMPRLAEPTRWGQIIRDCWAVVGASPMIVAAGWSIENLFGFDPDGMSYDYGLAVALRGISLAAINPDYATIPTSRGTIWHYPRLPVGAPLLWTFNERRL